MASITGFGGAFLRSKDPEALYKWYEKHFGLVRSDGSFAFPASTQRAAASRCTACRRSVRAVPMTASYRCSRGAACSHR